MDFSSANHVTDHITVLRQEAVEILLSELPPLCPSSEAPSGLSLPQGERRDQDKDQCPQIFIDGTFGRGGHSELILKNLDKNNLNNQLIGVDKDLDAVKFAQNNFSCAQDSRFKIVHSSFGEILKITKNLDCLSKISGVLLDLGVSSPQIDQAQRGMSFMKDGPLDMRMDQTQGQTCAEFLSEVDEEDLANILFQYGDEKFSRKIAKAITTRRVIAPILTTGDLAQIISEAVPFRDKHKHPATRSFQALRIYINKELEDLESFLRDIEQVLAPGGKLVIISFHSLEDRLVKNFFNLKIKGPEVPRHIPLKAHEYFKPRWKLIDKKIKPSEQELLNNTRARSAILRAGVFLG